MKGFIFLFSFALASARADTLTGKIGEYVIDRFDGTSSVEKVLLNSSGMYRLSGELPAAGSNVVVEADLGKDGTYVVLKSTLLSFSDPVSPETSNANILAVRVQFPGTPNTSCSSEQIQSKLFSSNRESTKSFFQEVSLGKLTVQGTVVPEVLEIQGNASTCDDSQWVNRAIAALSARGINHENYSHLMLFTPETSCNWAGSAVVGGRTSMIRGSSCGDEGVIGHEFGHNLGLFHASTPELEYGDRSDIMGVHMPLKGFHAAHRHKLGWFNSGELATNAGTVEELELTTVLYPGKDPGMAQALRLQTPEMAHPLYFSFRKSAGYDASLPSIFFEQLSIHRFTEGRFPRLISYLGAGNSFPVGENTGMTVRVLEMDSDRARIQIARDCVKAPPTLTARPGDLVTPLNVYNEVELTVTNNDNGICPATTIDLSANVANGAEAVLPAWYAAVTLKGGESLTVNSSVRTTQFNEFLPPSVEFVLRSSEHKDAVTFGLNISVPQEPAVPVKGSKKAGLRK